MTVWVFGPLLAAVERRHGAEQRKLLQPALNSVRDRREFARFHYFSAFDGIEALIAKQSGISDVLMLMSDDPEFREARFLAASHITAFVHNLHAIGDTLGQVVYFALGMNVGAASSKRSLYAHSVRDLLPLGRLRDIFSELLDHDGYAYLTALSNRSKHYSIVPTPYSIDMTPERATGDGIRFDGFAYKGETYVARLAKPIMQAEYDRQARLLQDIGAELDVILGG